MAKDIKIRITAQNAIKSGIASASRSLNVLKGVAIRVAAGIAAAFAAIAATVKKAFDFERAKVQLKTLLGSADAADKRFSELKMFSAKTPFQLEGILEADRHLTTFSEGLLGGAKSLKLVGDAAASTNNSIESVSFWFGRAFSMLKAGKPFGEAAMRLQEMGILSAKARNEMENLQKSGAGADKIYSVLTRDFARFNGGMEDLSQTGHGLFSTLKDNWTLALAEFGEKFADIAKRDIQTLISAIQNLRENGSIEAWATQTLRFLKAVGHGIATVAKPFRALFGGGQKSGGMTEQQQLANINRLQAGLEKLKSANQEKTVKNVQAELAAATKTNDKSKEKLKLQKEILKLIEREKELKDDIAKQAATDALQAKADAIGQKLNDALLRVGAAQAAQAAIPAMVGGFIAQEKAKEAQGDAEAEELLRETKLRKKMERGIKLSRRDRDWMAASARRKEAMRKQIDAENKAQREAKRLADEQKALQEKIAKLNDSQAKSLSKISNKLDSLLQMV